MVSDAQYKRTMKALREREAKEALSRKFNRQRKQARAIRDAFKPRKADLGRVVLVGRNGKVLPPRSKRKAIPVYVTTTGKKRLYVRTQIKNPYALRTPDNVKLSAAKNMRLKTKAFEVRRLKEVGRGKIIRASRARKGSASNAEKLAKGRGVKVTPGEYSESVAPKRGTAFSDVVVNKLAESLGRAMKTHQTKQVYLVTALAEIDGEFGRDVVQTTFSLGRSEQYFFSESPRSFVRNAFYASFAQQLAFAGYVVSGSANHIRRATGENVVTREVWEQYHQEKGRDMTWQGAEFNVVDLVSLEWKIERT